MKRLLLLPALLCALAAPAQADDLVKVAMAAVESASMACTPVEYIAVRASTPPRSALVPEAIRSFQRRSCTHWKASVFSFLANVKLP